MHALVSLLETPAVAFHLVIVREGKLLEVDSRCTYIYSHQILINGGSLFVIAILQHVIK